MEHRLYEPIQSEEPLAPPEIHPYADSAGYRLNRTATATATDLVRTVQSELIHLGRSTDLSNFSPPAATSHMDTLRPIWALGIRRPRHLR